ncbi:glycosyltransferase family A protein [Luteimonas sp. MJ293]|uniref:glycosyltransferase family A protein n=1 Tax=Luteimonas sp. MJ146 TaxID=3129240 RepID=UPI0031BAB382
MTDLPPPHAPRNPERDKVAELRRLRRQLRETEQALQLREDELAVLRGSHSFKLTAPLRWLRGWLSRSNGSGVPATAVPAWGDQLPPAIKAFPWRLVKHDAPERLNDSHRPLKLDDVLQPLVPVDVVDGGLQDPDDPLRAHHHGDVASPLRLATVACRELRQELSFDASVLALHADCWKEQLRARVDFVLIDGAWEPEGQWGAGFGASPTSQSRLQPLLEYCRSHAIPVVLWAREDASELDRMQWLVPRVDRVYAVDGPGLARLERDHPGRALGLLPVAVQPALYNPVRSYGLRDCQAALAGTALFDGWWALSSDLGTDPLLAELCDRLRVVDTRGDYSWVRLQDNAPYAPLTLGSLTTLEKSALLRSGSAELFLPAPASRPWRQADDMLRAVASGASVLRGRGAGGPNRWAQDVCPKTLLGRLEASSSASPEGARAAHLAFREVLAHHCLADRLAVIARDLGVDARVPEGLRVAHLLVTMRPELLERCLERFRADQYPDRELVVVLHGDGVDMAAARSLVREGEPVKVLQAGAERSLGDCLNMAIAHTDAPFWMKLDDDDHYGPEYTRDVMLYRRAVPTPLMGKPPAFVHLAGADEVRWDPQWASYANLLHDPEEASAALVAGGTLAGTREVLESMRFSSTRRGGSDSEFIERCLAEGHSVLATDPFNFARYRSGEEGFHTWKVADDELRQGTVLLGGREVLDRLVFI